MPMTTIQVQNEDLPVLLSTPANYSGAPIPGVIAIHDLTGFNQDIKRISQRIADRGYIVATPDLYHGGKIRCITRVMRDVMTAKGPSLEDLDGTRSALSAHPQCNGSIGVVGFCQGGRFALLLARRGYDAVAPFYSTPLPPKIEQHLSGSCPVVASFGGRDLFGLGAGKKLQTILDEADVVNDVKTYPEAGHSFANELPGQAFLRLTGFGYQERAADDSWQRVFGFFDTYLRGNSSRDGDPEAM